MPTSCSSRDLVPRNDQHLNDLYDASNAARTARKSINESLQKHKSIEDDLRAKYGSLRESMNKSKLLVCFHIHADNCVVEMLTPFVSPRWSVLPDTPSTS